MYDLVKSQACLKTSVGFKQNENPRYPPLDPSLLTTTTGVEVDHDLINSDNLWNTLDVVDPSFYEEYNPITIYPISKRIKVTDTSGILGPTSYLFFESLQNGNVGNTPATSPLFWDPKDLISEYLDQVKENAIQDVLRDVYVKQKMNNTVKNLFENITLFTKAGRVYNKEVKDNRFVGFEITVKKSQYLTAVIEKIGVQFSEINNPLNLLLYHSSSVLPILTIPVSNTVATTFNWNDISNAILRFTSDNQDHGGTYFIGYRESELVGQACVKNEDITNAPCGSCDQQLKTNFVRRDPYISVHSFFVNETELGAGNEIWDIENTKYVSNNNWGLNLNLSIKCDVSDLFCDQTLALAEPIRIEIEKKILRMMKLNHKSNTVAEQVKALAADELDSVGNANSLTLQYKDAIAALNFDLSEMQSACVPCQSNSKIRPSVV